MATYYQFNKLRTTPDPVNDVTLIELYDEIVVNRKEIKNFIHASESRLEVKINELKDFNS